MRYILLIVSLCLTDAIFLMRLYPPCIRNGVIDQLMRGHLLRTRQKRSSE